MYTDNMNFDRITYNDQDKGFKTELVFGVVKQGKTYTFGIISPVVDYPIIGAFVSLKKTADGKRFIIHLPWYDITLPPVVTLLDNLANIKKAAIMRGVPAITAHWICIAILWFVEKYNN